MAWQGIAMRRHGTAACVGDGDATSHNGAAGDGPHAGTRLFSDAGCACSIVSNRCDFISDEIGRFCYHNRMVKRSVRTRRCVDGHSARPAYMAPFACLKKEAKKQKHCNGWLCEREIL